MSYQEVEAKYKELHEKMAMTMANAIQALSGTFTAQEISQWLMAKSAGLPMKEEDE